MSKQGNTFLAIFDAVDAAAIAIEKLRKGGMKEITVFSPMPRHELEHALDSPESPVRIFTLVGALIGTASGFALPIYASLDWPLMTGGKPIISLPAFVIIAFEMTILFGALATVLGLFINARLPHVRANVIYDKSFSVGSFGVFVASPAGREGEVRKVFEEASAIEVRENPREVRVGD